MKRAEPMDARDFITYICHSRFFKPHNFVYWYLFLFAFFLCARKSNLVPFSSSDIESGKFLSRESIQFHENYILVHFNWSKTGQRLFSLVKGR